MSQKLKKQFWDKTEIEVAASGTSSATFWGKLRHMLFSGEWE